MKILSQLFVLALVVVGFVACDSGVEEPNQGTFTVTIENVLEAKNYQASGTVGGLIMPDEEMTFSFHAGKGSYLNFATMFVQSNDLFYGFDDTGLALYDDNGNAVTGDVSSSITLWDAGTEVNEMPGTGPNQAPRQSGANTGTDENGSIRPIDDGFTYPVTTDVIQVTLAHDGGTEFTVTLKNISSGASLTTPFAGGVFAVHGSGVKLFSAWEAASEGLERIAEDGNNEMMAAKLTENTGYSSPFAPGVWAVHGSDVEPIFTENSADRGEGLEALAEDGDPAGLNTSLEAITTIANGIFNTPDGASVAGPLASGGTYSFTFTAQEGDYLSLATMLVHTNDLFYGFGGNGIALFDNDGNPITGDMTSKLYLWDAGTEVNEYPGAGNYQPARGGANVGMDENGNVRIEDDNFTYPTLTDVIKVTISQ